MLAHWWHKPGQCKCFRHAGASRLLCPALLSISLKALHRPDTLGPAGGDHTLLQIHHSPSPQFPHSVIRCPPGQWWPRSISLPSGLLQVPGETGRNGAPVADGATRVSPSSSLYAPEIQRSPMTSTLPSPCARCLSGQWAEQLLLAGCLFRLQVKAEAMQETESQFSISDP